MDTGALKARWKPRRAAAASKQSRAGCSQAPRPGSLAEGSGTTRTLHGSEAVKLRPRGALAAPRAAADRVMPARRRRCPCSRAPGGSPGRSSASSAARRSGSGGRSPGSRGSGRRRPRLLLVAALGLLLGELGLGADVDAPAGQAGGEPGVLALAADRQRELVVGHDHRRLLAVVVDQHLAHARRAERLGDEAGGLVVVRDDVDLLAAQLGHDHAHARAARADAGADRVDAVGVRDDRDLRAVAGLARDVGDLHQAVGDLRHLELEQLLDQLRVAAARR